MTDLDTDYLRCRCGHLKKSHDARGWLTRCQHVPHDPPVPAPWAPASGYVYRRPRPRERCTCTMFAARPPRWRVACYETQVEWFGPPFRTWLVTGPDGEPPLNATFGDHATAFRVAEALAVLDAEREASIGRHPAGKAFEDAKRAVLTWANPFRPFPTWHQAVDEARAKLRTMPHPPNPLLVPMHTVEDKHDAETRRGFGISVADHSGWLNQGPIAHYVVDDDATIADKAEHYRER